MFNWFGNFYHYCFIAQLVCFMVSLGSRNRFGFYVLLDFAMNPFWLLQECDSVAKDEDLQDFLKTKTSSLRNE